MAKRSKRFQKAQETVETLKQYSVTEASEIVAAFPKAKFDESIDVAISLGVNPKKAEENVRGTVVLPHGTGKTKRVLAFASGEKAKEAEAAGADFVGADDIVKKIQEGWLDFDAVVATPDSMALVGRVGKLLGPRGLMPNPKVGSVTVEIGKAIEAIKSGRVEFRVEKAGIVHLAVGKSSFGPKKIQENLSAAIDAIVRAKPSTSKGVYIKSVFISTTMGPSVALDAAVFKQ